MVGQGSRSPTPEVDVVQPIKGAIKGRGVAKFNMAPEACLCQRPYTHILCENCGYLMFGRVRYRCPKHPRVTFLIDITNCPRCRCFEYMLTEVSL